MTFFPQTFSRLFSAQSRHKRAKIVAELELYKFFVVVLLLFSIASCARSQTNVPTIKTELANTGSITIYLRDELGEPISVTPIFYLRSTTRGLIPGDPGRVGAGDGWVYSDILPGEDYNVEVRVSGYQPAQEPVSLNGIHGENANVIMFLTPIDERLKFHPPTGQFVLDPSAQKEVEKGMKDLRDGNDSSSRKHFTKALAMEPGNPYINYAMGMSYLLAKKLSDARPYLEKSVSIDPTQSLSLLALGTLRFQSADYPGAVQSLSEGLKLDPSSWKAEWMLAESYLHQRDFAESRSHAEKALALGKQKAISAQLVLGQALAGLGDRESAVKALQAYVTAYPQSPNLAKIQNYVVKLQQSNETNTAGNPADHGPSAAVSAVELEPLAVTTSAPDVDLPPKENWAPADIDAEKPFLISAVSCPLSDVLDKVGKNADRLVTDLEEFTATEQYQSVEVKRDERLQTPVTRNFNYLVYIERPQPNLIDVDEVRNDNLGPADMPGGQMSDNGAPGLVLAFHPNYRNDFNWRCEGLGQWKDQPTWLVHFEQRSDRPISLLAAFITPSGQFNLPLKGRAWVSTKTGQVVRLEADLVHPVEPLDLKRQHFAIDYAPVIFAAHNVTLWLPESVDVYLQYRGHYLHRHHQLSNFKLFWVGSSQKIGQPKQTSKPKPPS